MFSHDILCTYFFRMLIYMYNFFPNDELYITLTLTTSYADNFLLIDELCT
jgi:hypothetical protein